MGSLLLQIAGQRLQGTLTVLASYGSGDTDRGVLFVVELTNTVQFVPV
jgi:hypothetical protein